MTPPSLNALCPYFTMYPLDFPLRVLNKESGNGGWVYDPFCGRGTTNFAARLRGMPSVGLDSSPVAVAIAQAKVVSISSRAVIKCAEAIVRDAKEAQAIPNGAFWRWAFSDGTLADLCRIREELRRECKSSARKVLRALVLGALHGPLRKGSPSYFSNQCLRTFAPKPAYALQFWMRHKLNPPVVDVLGVIRRRAERFLSAQLPRVEGSILLRDSRTWLDEDMKGLFSWIVTSPPYYGMKTYLPDQWLRHWFVGGPVTVNYTYPSSSFSHSSPEHFSKQLRRVWRNAAVMCKPKARLVCRFGGIHDRKKDCLQILKSSFRDSGWRLTTIRNAGSALDGRRQAAQFGEDQRDSPREEYDVYARLNN